MEENKNSKQPIPIRKSTWKSFLGKKWAFPAIYIGTAAIILAFVMWYQGNATNYSIDSEQFKEPITSTMQEDSQDAAKEQTDEEAVPVANNIQPLQWPVAQGVKYELGMGFFDDQAPQDKQQAALVKFDDSYVPHTGIDVKSTDGKTFDVAAALAGKVVKTGADPIVGNYVEIEHADKMKTVYQSLEKVNVKIGDEVTQGQVIGTAGRNVFEKDAGIHLHFEVQVDGKAVNPETYLTQAESR